MNGINYLMIVCKLVAFIYYIQQICVEINSFIQESNRQGSRKDRLHYVVHDCWNLEKPRAYLSAAV